MPSDPPGTVEAAAAPTLIDTDVHNMLGDLVPYLPQVWQDRWQQVGFGTGANWSSPRGVHPP